ncbi:hypothetical protein KKC_02884 [Listeria fleischmannii subsp. coloradonensis]|uniref:Uncharacterized protein n=1 Tax=Listeria fleischmannii FSL S10-1203 TaxID=1265822 RepID=W7DQ32_9LIST|nr:hypothetical protein KKC_02884 [Listeria fleischmannii subsp. coloradonensis]EUJ51870.1 hypothetical protein MCOL2_14693 [Listeria fleischmannii FSL S10-1203]
MSFLLYLIKVWVGELYFLIYILQTNILMKINVLSFILWHKKIDFTINAISHLPKMLKINNFDAHK